MESLSYQKLQVERGPRTLSTLPPEWKHWSRFKTAFEKTLPNAINHISSNHNPKNNIFFSAGRIVEMYSCRQASITKSFTKYKDNVTALSCRNDAKMFAVGLQSGLILLTDVKNKLNLRTFDNHKKRVNALYYSDMNDLFSGGDDMTIRKFDVAAGSVVHSIGKAHKDYIKAIKAVQENQILTGGYDGLVKLFDFRVGKDSKLAFEHGDPVQALDSFPSGLSAISVGGTTIKIWDLRMSKQLHTISANKKTVTSIKILQSGQRFLTGSIDQHLKIYTADTFQLTYNEKYQDAILSVDSTHNQQLFAVGMNNGQILIRKSGIIEQQQSEQDIQQILPSFFRGQAKTPTYNNSFFYRGIYAEPKEYDQKVQQIVKRSNFYDRCLKKFEYRKALVGAAVKKQFDVFVSLVLELEERGVLERAISTLDETELKNILEAMEQRIRNPKWRNVILRLLQLLWDRYGLQSLSRESWTRIYGLISQQVKLTEEILGAVGLIECLEAAL